MHCVKCGTALPEASKFCPSCGNQAEDTAPADGQGAAHAKFLANLVDGVIAPSMFALDRMDQKKLAAARKSYLNNESESESALVLHDDTVFGNAKKGFVITNEQFASNIDASWGGKVRKFQIPLSDIQAFRIEKGKLMTSNLYINNEMVGNITQIEGANLDRINMLLALVISHPGEFTNASSFPAGPTAGVSTVDVGAPQTPQSSKSTNWASTLGGLVIMAAVGFAILGPDSDFSTTSRAEQIIKKSLKAPASYREVDSRVLWTGKDQKGNKANIVLVEYDAQNGFGALLRYCNVISYIEEGGDLKWNPTFGVQTCTTGYLSEADTVKLYKETNFGL